MSVQWVSMGGISLWSPFVETGPWSSIIDNTIASNPFYIHWRLGGDPAVNQHAGSVVRGFRLQGALNFPGVSQMDMAALRGIAYSPLSLNIPGKSALDNVPPVPGRPNARYNFDWQVARTKLPIGLLPGDTNWWNPADPNYGGVRTTQSVQLMPNAAGSGRIMRADPGVVQLLVSDPPTAVVQTAPQLRVGQKAPVTTQVYYPGFESDGIGGVNVSLSASSGTQVSTSEMGSYGAIATATTDDLGLAYFWVKAVSGDAGGALVFDIAGDADVIDTLRSTVGYIKNDVASPVVRPMSYIRQLFLPQLPLRVPIAVYADPPPPGPGQCTTFPAIPDVPGTPSRTEVADDFGWNTGAHSIEEADGDFELRFDEMDGGAVGAVIGIMPAVRQNPGDYTRVTHGFYFTKTAGGTKQVSIIESGRTVAGPFGYGSGIEFSIQRVGAAVIYLIGGFPEYSSRRPLEGTAMAATSLYATSDMVPSNDPTGDCFWTDIVGASQQCGGGSSDLQPLRSYIGDSNNGVAEIRYGSVDDIPGENPYVQILTGFTAGIYLDAGQWKLLVSTTTNYFPSAADDYMLADVIIERVPRVTFDPHSPREFVANFSGLNLPKTYHSNNGGVPHQFGSDISGLPAFDPAYVYIVSVDYNIYSASGELAETNSSQGAVFESSVEDGVTAPSLIHTAPVGSFPEAFDTRLSGYGIYFIDGPINSILYTGPRYMSSMPDFTCNNFMASIDGQPVITFYAICS